MNITVNSSNLAQELRILNKICAAKTPLAILSNILFNATETLRLSATNLEVGMHTLCPANIEEPGSITLPGKKLQDIVDQLPDAEVRITTEKNQVKLISGSFKSRIQTLPSSEFPPLPEVEGDVSIISSSSLKRAIESTSYAISESTQKYVMDGALLSLTGPTTAPDGTAVGPVMAMVATDGKRLSLITATRVDGPAMTAVIPSKTLDVLASLNVSGDVEFSYSDRHLFFVAKDRLLFSRMLDGKFPSYGRIIPRDCDKTLSVSRAALTAAIKRVGVMSDVDNLAVMMQVTPGQMVLLSRSAGVGDGEEVIQVNYDKEPFDIAVRSSYLLDFLGKATQPSVTMATKKDGPLLLSDGPEFINVIMPIRS